MERMLAPTLLLTISLAFYNCAALAQKPPRPKGKISTAEILDKHIAAVGKPEVLNALQTLHVQGIIGLSPMPPTHGLGDFHFYYKAPASDVFSLDAISHGQSSIGHNEGAPFSKHTVRGIGGLNGVSLNILEENWLGLIESRFDQQHYPRIELLGLAEIDGRWAYALGFTPQVGDRQIRYYDCESFLMVRMDLAQRYSLEKGGPESAYKVETYYSDYRDSAGINLPRKIRASASNGDLVLDVQEIRANMSVADSVFQKN